MVINKARTSADGYKSPMTRVNNNLYVIAWQNRTHFYGPYPCSRSQIQYTVRIGTNWSKMELVVASEGKKVMK